MITVKSFDTLQVFDRLKRAEASEALAREVAELFRETTEERSVTKADLEQVHTSLKKEIEALSSRMDAMEQGYRSDAEKRDQSLRAEIRASEQTLRTEMKEMENSLRADMREMENSLRTDIKEMENSLRADRKEMEIRIDGKIEAKIHEAKVDIIKWVAGLLLAQAGLVAALVKIL